MRSWIMARRILAAVRRELAVDEPVFDGELPARVRGLVATVGSYAVENRKLREIPYEVFEKDMLNAFRTGAHYGQWERCITPGPDRTLSGLRAALREAGITVAPPAPSRRVITPTAEQPASDSGLKSSGSDL